MEWDEEFRAFGQAIASDPIGVLLAKWRRDAFIAKLEKLPDVAEVIESGSLARGTQIGPVYDIDLIVVFKSSAHPDYGRNPESAQAAMTHLENQLGEQLHPWLGPREGALKETEQRTHVVTCYAGWTEALAGIMPLAPPVDVMPAVREGSHLLIPERGTGWIDADPEHLIRQVAQRQREWGYFKEVIGMVKAWAEHNHLGMRNLAIEVMVLQYCPRPRWFETLSYGEAITRFFETAAGKNIRSLVDPAKRCGEIDPGMNYMKLRAALKSAARLARQAMDVEHLAETPYGAAGHDPSEFWRELFGRKFPRARKRSLRHPAVEPWFGGYVMESAVMVVLDDPGPPDGKHRPNRPGGGPEGPDDNPDDPDLWPRRPAGGPDWPWRPGAPRNGRGPHRQPGPQGPGDSPGPALAEPGANLWTGVFGPAAATVSVPLTFG